MRKFLIATHGTLASGIQNALRIITGEIDRVMVIDAFAGPENPVNQIQIYFDQLNDQDEVIILTDLPGGSVNQMLIRQQMLYINEKVEQMSAELNAFF